MKGILRNEMKKRNKVILENEIEQLRAVMHETAAKFGLQSPETLSASKRVDEKINLYLNQKNFIKKKKI